MGYKLIITRNAEILLDELIYYLLVELDNRQAAKRLFDEVKKIYDRIELNPYQFPRCRDLYLRRKGYYEAIIPSMNYKVVFIIDIYDVYILGIFHNLENYQEKL